jgi:hypothetical protein
MSLSNKTKIVGSIVFPLTIIFTTHSTLAGAGEVSIPTTTPTVIPANNITPIESTTTQVNQPYGGIVQFNGYSNPSIPNCSSSCTYLNLRVLPSNNGASQAFEGTIGFIFQNNFTEKYQAESIKLTSELQKYRVEHEIIDYLSRQLADALENNKFDRARIIAINLAPKLGYSDYRIYLQKITSGKFSNP